MHGIHKIITTFLSLVIYLFLFLNLFQYKKKIILFFLFKCIKRSVSQNDTIFPIRYKEHSSFSLYLNPLSIQRSFNFQNANSLNSEIPIKPSSVK